MGLNGIGNKNQTLTTGRIAYGRGTDGDYYPLSSVNGKTIQAVPYAASTIAASTLATSNVVDLTKAQKATFFIDHGRAATAAFGALGGTNYVIQVSEKASGNDTWVAYTSVVASSAAASSALSSGAVAIIAATSIVILSGTAFVGADFIMWANTADMNGSTEWAQVKDVTGTASFTIVDGLTNFQGSTVVITSQAGHWALTVDCSSFTRARVLINNTTGTTSAIRSRVACILV